MLEKSFHNFFVEARSNYLLVEDSSTEVLNHLAHLEELILVSKQQGLEMTLRFLSELYETFKGRTDSPVYTTVKFDGAPSVFAGYHPETNKFFVATKSITNVNPKINYTDEDIERNHGHAAGLVTKLKLALKYLPSVIKQGIYQGDFMFAKEDLQTTTVGDEELIVFKPNTITYAIERHSPLGQRILNSQIGVIFHTRYNGETLATIKRSSDVNASEFQQSQDVFLDDAKFKDLSGLATFTKEESNKCFMFIESIKKLGNKVAWEQLDGMSQDVYTHIKTYVNNLIRKGEFVKNPEQAFIKYVEWIGEIANKQTSDLKTEKGKARRQEKFSIYLREVNQNKNSIVSLFALTKKIAEAKNLFVTKYNTAIKTKQFITQPNGTLKVTAPEGYVAVDHLGNMIKLVDRLEFSKANFAVSKEEKFK